jgi:hypothetical protein
MRDWRNLNHLGRKTRKDAIGQTAAAGTRKAAARVS